MVNQATIESSQVVSVQDPWRANPKTRVELEISDFSYLGHVAYTNMSMSRAVQDCSFTFQGKQYKRLARIESIGNFAPAFISFAGSKWLLSDDTDKLIRFI